MSDPKPAEAPPAEEKPVAEVAEEKKPKNPGHSSGFGRISGFVEEKASHALANLSAGSARKPRVAIGVATAVWFVGFVCFIVFTLPNPENDGFKLWPIPYERTTIMMSWRDRNWGKTADPIAMYLVDKDCMKPDQDIDDTSGCAPVWKENAIDLMMEIDHTLQTTKADIIDPADKKEISWMYHNSCFISAGAHYADCQSNSITDFFNRD